RCESFADGVGGRGFLENGREPLSRGNSLLNGNPGAAVAVYYAQQQVRPLYGFNQQPICVQQVPHGRAGGRALQPRTGGQESLQSGKNQTTVGQPSPHGEASGHAGLYGRYTRGVM